MPDVPDTGGAGIFQKKGGTRRPAEVAAAPAVEIPPSQTVQLLGLISRIQLLEGSLSQLRREKLLGEQDTAGLIEPPTDEERAAAARVAEQKTELEANISIMEGIIRNAIQRLSQRPDFVFADILISGDLTEADKWRRLMQGLLQAAIDLPRNA